MEMKKEDDLAEWSVLSLIYVCTSLYPEVDEFVSLELFNF